MDKQVIKNTELKKNVEAIIEFDWICIKNFDVESACEQVIKFIEALNDSKL